MVSVIVGADDDVGGRRAPLKNVGQESALGEPVEDLRQEGAIQVVTMSHQVKKMNLHPAKDEPEFEMVDKMVSIKKVIPDNEPEDQADSSLR